MGGLKDRSLSTEMIDGRCEPTAAGDSISKGESSSAESAIVTTSRQPLGYQQLIGKTRLPDPPTKNIEGELDALVNSLEERQKPAESEGQRRATDPLHALREMTVRELVPVFVELVEKYSKSGISLQMDASSLLEGGREIKFEFGIGEHRVQLQGTVTSDAIAFHEVRYAPDIDGQLLAGPMLRLKQLNAKTFREFVCERLAMLLKSAARRK